MKRRALTRAIALLAFLAFSCVFHGPGASHAECAVTCFMTCGNRCEAQFTNCGLLEWIEKVGRCCAEAAKITGDTGPCPEE